jgi:hypothetical protein
MCAVVCDLPLPFWLPLSKNGVEAQSWRTSARITKLPVPASFYSAVRSTAHR